MSRFRLPEIGRRYVRKTHCRLHYLRGFLYFCDVPLTRHEVRRKKAIAVSCQCLVCDACLTAAVAESIRRRGLEITFAE